MRECITCRTPNALIHLMVRIDTAGMDLSEGDVEAMLTIETFDGTQVARSDGSASFVSCEMFRVASFGKRRRSHPMIRSGDHLAFSFAATRLQKEGISNVGQGLAHGHARGAESGYGGRNRRGRQCDPHPREHSERRHHKR